MSAIAEDLGSNAGSRIVEYSRRGWIAEKNEMGRNKWFQRLPFSAVPDSAISPTEFRIVTRIRLGL